MPNYDWRCKICKYEVSLILPVTEYKTEPTEPCKCMDGDAHENPQWERFLKSAPAMDKGPGWGGGKGNW